MSKVLNYIRQVLKGTNIANAIPTLPSSNDHTDNTWLTTDLYDRELFVNTTDKKIWVRTGTTFTELKKPMSNVATTNPTVNDDASLGYDVSSMWYNSSLDLFYFCTDSTINAAVWKKISITGVITLQGDWNANTNTPDITTTTTTGYAWRVSVAGSTNLGGITTWHVGDLAVKTATSWIKIDNQEISAVWGNITGAITDQTDIQNALLNGITSYKNLASGDNTLLKSLQKFNDAYLAHVIKNNSTPVMQRDNFNIIGGTFNDDGTNTILTLPITQYDASITSFSDLQTAITSGKKNLLLLNNITFTSDLDISGLNISITGLFKASGNTLNSHYLIDLVDYKITFTGTVYGSLRMRNISIQQTTTAETTFIFCNNYLSQNYKNVYWNKIAASTKYDGIFSLISDFEDNLEDICINNNGASATAYGYAFRVASAKAIINNISINGASVNAMAFLVTAGVCIFNNLVLSGIFKSSGGYNSTINISNAITVLLINNLINNASNSSINIDSGAANDKVKFSNFTGNPINIIGNTNSEVITSKNINLYINATYFDIPIRNKVIGIVCTTQDVTGGVLKLGSSVGANDIVFDYTLSGSANITTELTYIQLDSMLSLSATKRVYVTLNTATTIGLSISFSEF